MNEYDPMKENTSSNDQGNKKDTYSPSDRGYAFQTNPDGQGYTNPDGSHGFIYNPGAQQTDPVGRSYRGAFIAVLSVLVAVIIAGGCFLGAWMAARTLDADQGKPSPDELNTATNDMETSGGLFISDDTADEENHDMNLSPSVPGENVAGGNEGNDILYTGTETTPGVDSITKLPSERVDANGDGKADVEFDANGQVLTSAGTDVLSVATVVNRVAASVVEITTETVVQSGFLGQYISSGAGSGVIVSEDGYIVTNNHVIEGASTITVRLNDGTEYPATLIGTDEQTDIAVLRIDPGSYALTVATLGSSFDLVVGEDILAIGNPLGSLGGTVTEGMISATARQITVSGNSMTLLQISAPINPGNSGGGLFNLAGELVGVVNAKMSSEEIEGLGFAVPIDTAYEIILELIHHGYVRGRPSLDFTVVDVTNPSTAYYYFKSTSTGVYVYDDDHAIMQYGDHIVSADGESVSTTTELNAIIQSKKVGDVLELTVSRNRKVMTLSVKITEYIPEAVQPAS